METSRHPYLKSLAQHGYIQGVTLHTKATNTPLCHYFGGVRYALAPSERWRRAQKLPQSYSYGTKDQPGSCGGNTGVCPQPGFMDLSGQDDWTEDCFQCNLWVPLGEPPREGWPVLFFIHGGFLQFGDPNTFSAAALLGDAALNAIVVVPAYRLNVFGFLYSSELEQDATSTGETVGNHGFWDQRQALEWTRDHIALFGGNASQITISGYSAGAYSAFYQLAYDLQIPDGQSIIKRACLWSNSPVAQPKPPSSAQIQFNQLLSVLDIPASLPWNEKLSALRAVPSKTLLTSAMSIDINQFRPTSDSVFIQPTLFHSFDTGAFARKLSARNVRILLGECRDERNLYATWFPPTQNSLQSLHQRLLADYPSPVVDALINLYYPDGRLPADCENWETDAFGRVYADMQVHKMQRGLIHSLAAGGAEHLLYRYRVEYRLKCADKTLPPSWGVTHATDQYIWFWGNGEVIDPEEKPIVRRALIDPFVKFVHGEDDIQWGTANHQEIRTLKPDGSVQIIQDPFWDEAMRVWKALREVGEPDHVSAAKL
ncbi:carboxylesterase-lipase family protein [Aspergillus heteromorphus CBS 117.55]|uniref:Carboxylic ester hydrolase n=1 Tax=Aspergillus heteromorphus CBS 117.55 TaxID=1448321 RepID=A0A317WM76_9EURO|nr:carboxylesterase-lipase family protein [Aspergillus heteromorphus CBS 117.55]PWY86128.1 carboxylesterase-lipase family protein [Aspergillus heteromorphus CBS 117.55]